MKIAYIINHPVLYGANLSLLNLITGLQKSYGIDLLVLSACSGGICDRLLEYNISFKIVKHYLFVFPELNCRKDWMLFFPRLFFRSLINVYALVYSYFLLKKENVDMIHTNIGPDYLGYYLSKLLKTPHIWHIREYQKLDFSMNPIFGFKHFRHILHKSNVIAITSGLFNYFDLSSAVNSTTIYNGIRSVNSISFKIEKENYFLYVGRLEENKGVFNLLITFSSFIQKFPSAKLLIVGTGEQKYVQRLLAFVETKDALSNILFLGFRKDVDFLMSKARALIVPSLNEGFGRITAEAMFNGCLVIGYNSAGTKEILEKKQLGLLYLASEDLFDHMEIVMTHSPDYYSEILEKAQADAIENYSIEMNIANTYDFYQQVFKNTNSKYR